MLSAQRKVLLSIFWIALFSVSFGQKKPLDHSVYDGWQSVGERIISPNGEWIAYAVDVQEGDGVMHVQKTDSSVHLQFPRGYNASFSDDNKYLILQLKPHYQEIRAAKIKKTKPEDFPKDSLGIYGLETGQYEKIAGVVSYKFPEKNTRWIAYHLFRSAADSTAKAMPADSLAHKKDTSKKSLPIIIEHVPDKKQKKKLSAHEEKLDQENEDQDGDEGAQPPLKEGTTLVVRDLGGKKQKMLQLVSEYQWSEKGRLLLVESTSSKKDKSIKPLVYIWRSAEDRFDTLLTGGNDFKSYAIDKNEYQIAFLAERDSSFKSLQKFYKLWYWRNGDKEARAIADKFKPGMKINWTISEHQMPSFSSTGKRLFFGTAPVKSVRDTSLKDIDLVKLDIWHYNDDFLQPYQLKNVDRENKRSYLAMLDLERDQLVQLGDDQMPMVVTSDEGDGSIFLGMSDVGYRIRSQWEGSSQRDLYAIDPVTGRSTLIVKNVHAIPQVSPKGKYILWYDLKQQHYFVYHSGKISNISKQVSTRLCDEEFDMPTFPTPYGIMKWKENDEAVYVYDRYDIWKLDPLGKIIAENTTFGKGRIAHTSYRYIATDPQEQFLRSGQKIILKTFNEKNKHAGVAEMTIDKVGTLAQLQSGPYNLGIISKARNADAFLYTKESFALSPGIHVSTDFKTERKLSNTNPQQAEYNWLKAELFTWKAYDGKTASGIVYTPENFEPGKKYPMIAYFYETLSDGLYTYLPPAPTPSRLNIPFFVSRGYVVLAPDIHYTNGYPGKSAYDYVVSGARALVKKGWVDSTRMGIQGQSWGGYQVAHIITRTNLFRAAWAGAPVVNMTSAYGGIRWESGLNRQFQYEKTQSRIGATLWEKPKLYIENSPLFHLPKNKTPLVIMANDNDGAVPWYQGIEMFTAMRRLNQKVWMLNYNGEAHNLVERKNRKDIQIREQQFFDWLLKGEKPAIWLTEGVPATEKGKTWGLEKVLE